MYLKLVIWVLLMSISAISFWSAQLNLHRSIQNICDEFNDMVDYNNDGEFDFEDINLITSVIENLDFNCWSWKICDFVTTENGQYSSADIWFLISVLQFWEFPETDEAIYTLEDFCPVVQQWAPYDVSLDPCFLSQLDYNNDWVVDVIDRKRVDEHVWREEETCPDGKICSFEYYGQCNEDFQLADSINLWYFILWHISLEDFKAQIGQCHEVECTANTCADYDAFDYNDDGRVDRDDARYLHSGWRIGHESCDTGTRYDSDRAERQMCCPAGKICDLRCGDNGVSEWSISYPDYSIFITNFRNWRLPMTVCDDSINICEESQFETEYIRWFGVRYFLAWDTYTPDQIIEEVAVSKIR
jgi:hypothetical protein